MPADRRDAGRARQRRVRAPDALALLGLPEIRVRFPAPPVAGDLVTALARVAHEPGNALGRASAAGEGRGDARGIERVDDAAVARARPVVEVGAQAEIGRALDELADLVHGFVALVAVGERQLGALLHVDDERHRQVRPVRPGGSWRPVAVAAQIARRRPHWTIRLRPTVREPIASAISASTINPVEIAASDGSGCSSRYCSMRIGSVLLRASLRKIEIG